MEEFFNSIDKGGSLEVIVTILFCYSIIATILLITMIRENKQLHNFINEK